MVEVAFYQHYVLQTQLLKRFAGYGCRGGAAFKSEHAPARVGGGQISRSKPERGAEFQNSAGSEMVDKSKQKLRQLRWFGGRAGYITDPPLASGAGVRAGPKVAHLNGFGVALQFLPPLLNGLKGRERAIMVDNMGVQPKNERGMQAVRIPRAEQKPDVTERLEEQDATG
jgi:hypothetical protein